jgi:UPF0755 protein
MTGPRRRSVEPPLTGTEHEMGTSTRNRLEQRERPGNNRRPKSRGTGWRGTLAVLAGGLAVLIVIVVLLPPLAGGLLRSMAEDNPDLLRLPFFADAVRDNLDDRLDRPAGTDATPVDFDIPLGTSSRDITDQLVDRGLVTDRLAFAYILINDGAGSRLQAGTHVLNRTMSPRQVSDQLQQPPAPVAPHTTIALRSGLRIEQVVAYLQDNVDDISFDPNDFYALAKEPPDDVVAAYPMLKTKPAGRSLEGYLGSGVFEMPKDTDARGFLDILLQRRQADLAPLVDRAPPDHLDDFYQVLILASIVEREAKLDADRPPIAGVYVNRLAGLANGVRYLNSEPTVVYAHDTIELREMPLISWPQFVFWSLTGYADLGDVVVPDDLRSFQTWHSTGLPDWPIASPSVASIEAALAPDVAEGYIFFFAKCDGSGGHWFEKTLDEHNQHIVECQNP